jgi:hypothetical protein
MATYHPTSPLRAVLDAARNGYPLQDYTVLAPNNDPYRIDTPTYHRAGAWLAARVRDLGLGARRIHLRGLHYALSMAKPPVYRPGGRGEPAQVRYVNDAATWDWLQSRAADGARWLGYLDFDQIVDEKNDPPIVREWKPPEPEPFLDAGLALDMPELAEVMPTIEAAEFEGTQPYKLVIFGEKSSLEPVLGQVAAEYRADLYVGAGDLTDTLIYNMARIGANDGRPMVVVTFTDADPRGWGMPIGIARKLQALRTIKFPGLQFQVVRGGITPDQAEPGGLTEEGLPVTPLKDNERNAEPALKWRDAWDREATEIDSITGPATEDILDRMARDALAPFFDLDLDRRVREAKDRWQEAARAAFEERIGTEELDRIEAEITERLETIEAAIEEINDSVNVELPEVLPEVSIPEAELNDEGVKRAADRL